MPVEPHLPHTGNVKGRAGRLGAFSCEEESAGFDHWAREQEAKFDAEDEPTGIAPKNKWRFLLFHAALLFIVITLILYDRDHAPGHAAKESVEPDT